MWWTKVVIYFFSTKKGIYQMTWIQGGPFLEISFLLALTSERRTFMETLLQKLKSFSPEIEIVASSEELKEKIEAFHNGYLDDEQDPNSVSYHSAKLPLYVDIHGKRKSILAIEQHSSVLVEVSFWFYGSVYDAPEWKQKGISKNQIPDFKKVLHTLFDTFDFILGTVGYEVSTTNLFDTEEGWPSEKYAITNLKKHALQTDDFLLKILMNKKYIDFEE